MKIIFNEREKGNVILPLVILLFIAISLGWVVLTYIGKSSTPPEGDIATSTTPISSVVETQEEQEISLLPQPAVVTSPEATKIKKATEATIKKAGLSASITLTSAKNNYAIGEEALVSVNLSTNADTAGADVYLEYNPSQLELLKANPAQGSAGKNVAVAYLANTGSIYGDFPQARLFDQGAKKIFVFSSLSKAQESFKGSGVIATLRFKTLAAGSATIKILATPGQTNDTNVALMGKGVDILKETKDITLTIR